MLFKSLEARDLQAYDLDVNDKKKRHVDLFNATSEAELTVNNIVDDMHGTWHTQANGVEYYAFTSTLFAVGEKGANVQSRQTGIKMLSDDFTVIVVINPVGVTYLEEALKDGKWQTTTDISINRNDWRDYYHEERCIVLSALKYLTDELRAITCQDDKPSEPPIVLPLPRRALDDDMACVTNQA